MIKFQSIKIQNFLSFKDVIFNFKDKGLYLINGANGSGKSSIFEAIAWVLFGKTFKTFKEDKIINKLEEKNCLVNLKFSIDDKKYQMIKTKKHDEHKDTTMLFIKINNEWENISGKDQIDTHKELEKLIGMNFKVFQQSIMLNSLNKSFAEMSDTDIKEIFDDILDLKVYSDLQEINKTKSKEIANKISKKIVERDLIAKGIESNKQIINSLHEDVIKIKKENESKISTTQENIKKYETDINKLQKEINNIDNYEALLEYKNEADQLITNITNKAKTIETSIKALQNTDLLRIKSNINAKQLYIDNNKVETKKPVIEKDLDKQAKIVAKISEKLDDKNEVNQSAQVVFKSNTDKITEYIDIIDAISDISDCPTCKQKVSEKHKKSIISEYQNKIQGLHSENAVLNNNTEKLVKEIEKLKEDFKVENKKYQDLEKEYNDYNEYQKKFDIIKQYHEDIEALKTEEKELNIRLDKLALSVKNYNIKLEELKQENVEISEKIDKIKQFRNAINSFTVKINAENKILDSLFNEVKTIENRILKITDDIENDKEKLNIINNEMLDDETELKYLDYLDYAFSNQGIKSMLLQNITPILNSIANNFSTDITNGHININFETQTYIKSTKQWKEKFKINIENKFGGETYSANSMGEKAIIDLCILEALNHLVSLRAGKAFNISVYDESFGALDDENSERVIKYLNKKAEKNIIYVVSHDSGFKNHFDDENIINVSKVKGYTRLEMR